MDERRARRDREREAEREARRAEDARRRTVDDRWGEEDREDERR